jgi:hypothetical protein
MTATAELLRFSLKKAFPLLANHAFPLYNCPQFLTHREMEKGRDMERRSASHTEEEELNQRRRLLNLARKGDPKAIDRLFELYQVRVYTGDKLGKSGRLPTWPSAHEKPGKPTTSKRPARRRPARAARRATTRKRSRRATHRR